MRGPGAESGHPLHALPEVQMRHQQPGRVSCPSSSRAPSYSQTTHALPRSDRRAAGSSCSRCASTRPTWLADGKWSPHRPEGCRPRPPEAHAELRPRVTAVDVAFVRLPGSRAWISSQVQVTAFGQVPRRRRTTATSQDSRRLGCEHRPVGNRCRTGLAEAWRSRTAPRDP